MISSTRPVLKQLEWNTCIPIPLHRNFLGALTFMQNSRTAEKLRLKSTARSGTPQNARPKNDRPKRNTLRPLESNFSRFLQNGFLEGVRSQTHFFTRNLACLVRKIANGKMKSLTLQIENQNQNQNQDPDKKQCVVCKKTFRRAYGYLSWALQKCCSKTCRQIRQQKSKGIRCGNRRLVTCPICKLEFYGTIISLKKHKNRQHSY